MSLVVRGFGLSGDRAGPVEFGYTLKLDPASPVPVPVQLLYSSIDNWYVIDANVKRRRPVTPIEWELLRQFLEVRARAAAAARDTREADRRMVRKLARQNIVVDSFKVRTPYARDYSGLQPHRQAVGNPTGANASLFAHGAGRKVRSSDTRRVRERIRG